MKRHGIITLLLLAFIAASPALLHAQIIKGEVFLGGNLTQVDGDECYRYRKLGIHAGAGALVPITNYLDAGLEVLFGQKGAYKRDSLNYHLGYFTGRYNLTLNYVEVPVMLYLHDSRFAFGLGVSYGRLVGLTEKIDGVNSTIGIGDGQLHWKEGVEGMPDISEVQDIKELSNIIYNAGYPTTIQEKDLIPQLVDNSVNYRPHDFNICVDVKARVWNGLYAELRYQYSLVPIRTRLFHNKLNPNELIDDIRVPALQRQYNNSYTLRLVYLFNERRSKANQAVNKMGGQ